MEDVPRVPQPLTSRSIIVGRRSAAPTTRFHLRRQRVVMPKDLTVILTNRPGTLADAAEALARGGVNIEGACGFPAGGEGVLHVLVDDADRARSGLEQAGLEVRAERDVVVLGPLPQQPGTLGTALRGIADAGANVDLLYLTEDGRVVVSGEDVEAIRRAANG